MFVRLEYGAKEKVAEDSWGRMKRKEPEDLYYIKKERRGNCLSRVLNELGLGQSRETPKNGKLVLYFHSLIFIKYHSFFFSKFNLYHGHGTFPQQHSALNFIEWSLVFSVFWLSLSNAHTESSQRSLKLDFVVLFASNSIELVH
jgi:hypothetical protein